MRLSGGGEVRGARRRPAGRRTQSVVMGYDPHALESDAESPALARGRLGESSGDLADSSWPCVRRELVLGGVTSLDFTADLQESASQEGFYFHHGLHTPRGAG